MGDILSIIESKNPDEVTQKDLYLLQILIEVNINKVSKLQRIHRELTGKEYLPPLRLKK